MTLKRLGLGFVVVTVCCAGAGADTPKKPLWLYTSLETRIADPLAKAFEEKHPEYSVQVFQGNCSTIEDKVDAEITTRNLRADLVLVSDPFWVQDLDKRGILAARQGHQAEEIAYYSLLVMVLSGDHALERRPRSFEDLLKPEYQSKVALPGIGDPGAEFTALEMLDRKYGWSYFKKLALNQASVGGDSEEVLKTVEIGEKKIGVVLLQDALASRARKSQVEVVYPSDGALIVPGVQAVIKGAHNQAEAEQLADFVLGAEGQLLLRRGYLYTVRKDVNPPEGAPFLSVILRDTNDWSLDLIRELGGIAKDVKKKIREVLPSTQNE
jgi:iron(III) transport system substrate-binding protein